MPAAPPPAAPPEPAAPPATPAPALPVTAAPSVAAVEPSPPVAVGVSPPIALIVTSAIEAPSPLLGDVAPPVAAPIVASAAWTPLFTAAPPLVTAPVIIPWPASTTVSLSFLLPPGASECFFLDAAFGDAVEASIVISLGGQLDARLLITAINPGGAPSLVFDRIIVSNVDDATGARMPTVVKKGHAFAASAAGTLSVCVDNRPSRYPTTKAVTLEVSHRPLSAPSPPPPVTASPPAAAPFDADALPPSVALSISSQRMHTRLVEIASLQAYHAIRERRHRATVDSTSILLGRVTLVKSAAVAATQALLIATIRLWFARPMGLPGGGLAGSRWSENAR